MRPVIVLVGMRGAGKSTAGALLARRLGLPFVDTDARVEAALGAPAADLFAAGRVAEFRAAEAAAVREALAGGPAVVATGGGAVEDEATRTALAGAFTAWLACPDAILAARVGASGRPSVTGAAPADEIAVLSARRAALYAACARLVVDAGLLGPDEVCDAVEHAWRRLPDHDVR